MKGAKLLCFLYLVAGTFAASAQQSGTISQSDFDGAVSMLKATGPLDLWSIKMEPDPDIRTKLEKLFTEQLAAISTISAAHKKADVSLLIPYLQVTEEYYYSRAKGFHLARTPESALQEQRKRYPVFALILDMPNAGSELETYIVDKKYPINMRLNALTLLGYLDKERLKVVGNRLSDEIKQTPSIPKQKNIIEYIDGVVNRRPGYGYEGGVHF